MDSFEKLSESWAKQQDELVRVGQEFEHQMDAMYRATHFEVKPHPSTYAYSDTQFQIIKKHIQKYEASLDADHEVAVWLTNFGQRVMMVVTNITYEKSVLMVFHGFVDGVESTLIQHISQLNFLLTKVPKEVGREKRKIGFGEQEK